MNTRHREQFASEDDFERDIKRARAERALLNKIGVSEDALLFGLLPTHAKDYWFRTTEDWSGWNFSLEDMAKFGIDNVTYEGDGQYPGDGGIKPGAPPGAA